MKTILLIIALSGTCVATAQTNTSNTPNSGANTTPPVPQTYDKPGDNMANPSNSTVPGASGSYSVDPGKSQLQNPGTNGSYTTYPSQPQSQPVITPTTQGSTIENKKGKK